MTFLDYDFQLVTGVPYLHNYTVDLHVHCKYITGSSDLQENADKTIQKYMIAD